MSSSSSPIGVFDSGVGGLSVLRQITALLPSESVEYYADTAHVPYGGRPLPEVQGFALEICDFLVSRGVKMIVMACNISSAIAVDAARARHPHIDIIGVIEPGAAAALQVASDTIGVLATQGTVTSGAYGRTLRSLSQGVTVREVACPKYVPLVEAGEVESEEAFCASLEYLAPLAEIGAQAVVLGCTHYPFLLPTLNRAASQLFELGQRPVVVDPAPETVRKAAALLSSRNLSADIASNGTYEYFVSGDVPHFEQQGALFLGASITGAHKVTL